MANGELDAAPPSRHARFRQIMNAAAGSAHADYQGYGRFWELPLAQLRQLELYGIPMMRAGGAPPTPTAAAGPASCCCPAPAAPSSAAAAGPQTGGGGDDAGLVRRPRRRASTCGRAIPQSG